MKQYNRILFVAENGTCRAPMAAGILGEYVLKHPVEIGARGMVVLFPEPLNQKAEAVMISNGINLDGYMSAQLTEEDFTEDTLGKSAYLYEQYSPVYQSARGCRVWYDDL